MDPKLRIQPERRVLEGFYFVFVHGAAMDWPEQFYALHSATRRAEVLAQQYPGCVVHVARMESVGSVEIPQSAILRTGVMASDKAA